MKKIVEIQTQIQQLMHKIGDHSNDNGKMISKFDQDKNLQIGKSEK
jgi:hypothetical protein